MAFFVSFILIALVQFCVLFASAATSVVGGGGSEGYFSDGKPTKAGWINIGVAVVFLAIGLMSQAAVAAGAIVSSLCVLAFVYRTSRSGRR